MKGRKKTSNELLFKIIVIGEPATGKSCLMIRYVKDDFDSKYTVTIGIQFASKVVKIDDVYSIKLQIWDTAGQESFRSIVRNFYRNTAAVFLVYDVTRKSTFQALNGWLAEARQNSPKSVMYILIGTHLDIVQADPSKRQVSKEEVQDWIKQNKIDLFFETSAKENINVGKAFDETGSQLFLNYIKNRTSMSKLTEQEVGPEATQLKNQSKKKNQGCC